MVGEREFDRLKNFSTRLNSGVRELIQPSIDLFSGKRGLERFSWENAKGGLLFGLVSGSLSALVLRVPISLLEHGQGGLAGLTLSHALPLFGGLVTGIYAGYEWRFKRSIKDSDPSPPSDF